MTTTQERKKKIFSVEWPIPDIVGEGEEGEVKVEVEVGGGARTRLIFPLEGTELYLIV